MPTKGSSLARVTVPCAREGCANTRDLLPSYMARNKSGRFFCGSECRNAAGSKPRTLPDLTCDVCGTVYRPGRAKTIAASRYCSLACKNTASTKPRIDVACLWCDEPLQTYVDSSGEPLRRYCSRACAAATRVTRGVGRQVNGREVLMHVSGYLMCWVPGRGRVMEHRYVVEQAIGRELRSDEQVHHMNYIKTDNRLENLALLSPSAHAQETRRETNSRAQAKAARIRELETELLRLRQQVDTEGI